MWDWMNKGNGSRVIDIDEYGISEIIAAVTEHFYSFLPGNSGAAYESVIQHASDVGLTADQAAAAAALYFAINHAVSPLDATIDPSAEFVALGFLMNDAKAWFDLNHDTAPVAAIKQYALESIREALTTPTVPGCTNNDKRVTAIPYAEKFAFPTARALLIQNDIAAFGRTGTPVFVGGNVNISASIFAQSGEPINISREQIEIQVVIGDMMRRNGFAPIRVTPAQIFRNYAGLSPDAYVTPQQEAEIENILDPLLGISGKLDFTTQVKTHTGIQRRHDYDYSKTALDESSLVVGVKRTRSQSPAEGATTYNGSTINKWYDIYEPPMYYIYGHAVNQIGYASTKLLSGGSWKGAEQLRIKKLNADRAAAGLDPVKENCQQKATIKTVSAATLRRYIIQQIDRIKHDSDKAKKRGMYTERLSLQTICDSLSIVPTDKKIRTLRKNVQLILKDCETDGAIIGFDEYKKGRAFAGYTITVSHP